MNSRLMMKTRAFAQVNVVLLGGKFYAHLETIYRCYHDDGYQGKRPLVGRDDHDEVHELQMDVNQKNSVECKGRT